MAHGGEVGKDGQNSEADDGTVCLACGGPVGHDGKYSSGGEVKKARGLNGPGPDDKRNGQDEFDSFAKALLKRGIRGL